MIPIIGVIISAYIITRMIELIANKNTPDVVGVCAFITIGVCIVGVVMLLSSSGQLSTLLSNIPSRY